jgi:hypothetical protein
VWRRCLLQIPPPETPSTPSAPSTRSARNIILSVSGAEAWVKQHQRGRAWPCRPGSRASAHLPLTAGRWLCCLRRSSTARRITRPGSRLTAAQPAHSYKTAGRPSECRMLPNTRLCRRRRPVAAFHLSFFFLPDIRSDPVSTAVQMSMSIVRQPIGSRLHFCPLSVSSRNPLPIVF